MAVAHLVRSSVGAGSHLAVVGAVTNPLRRHPRLHHLHRLHRPPLLHTLHRRRRRHPDLPPHTLRRPQHRDQRLGHRRIPIPGEEVNVFPDR